MFLIDWDYLLTGKGSKKVYESISLLQPDIKKTVKSIVKGKEAGTTEHSLDYETERKKFTEDIDQERLQTIMVGVSIDEQDALLQSVMNQYGYTQSKMPVNQSISLFGINDLPPSDAESQIWLSLVNQLTNPKDFLTSLKQYNVSFREWEDFGKIYPDVVEELKIQLFDLLTTLQTDNLSIETINLLGLIYDKPRITSDFFTKEEEPEVKPRPKKSKLSEQTLTQPQRIAAK